MEGSNILQSEPIVINNNIVKNHQEICDDLKRRIKDGDSNAILLLDIMKYYDYLPKKERLPKIKNVSIRNMTLTQPWRFENCDLTNVCLSKKCTFYNTKKSNVKIRNEHLHLGIYKDSNIIIGRKKGKLFIKNLQSGKKAIFPTRDVNSITASVQRNSNQSAILYIRVIEVYDDHIRMTKIDPISIKVKKRVEMEDYVYAGIDPILGTYIINKEERVLRYIDGKRIEFSFKWDVDKLIDNPNINFICNGKLMMLPADNIKKYFKDYMDIRKMTGYCKTMISLLHDKKNIPKSGERTVLISNFTGMWKDNKHEKGKWVVKKGHYTKKHTMGDRIGHTENGLGSRKIEDFSKQVYSQGREDEHFIYPQELGVPINTERLFYSDGNIYAETEEGLYIYSIVLDLWYFISITAIGSGLVKTSFSSLLQKDIQIPLHPYSFSFKKDSGGIIIPEYDIKSTSTVLKTGNISLYSSSAYMPYNKVMLGKKKVDETKRFNYIFTFDGKVNLQKYPSFMIQSLTSINLIMMRDGPLSDLRPYMVDLDYDKGVIFPVGSEEDVLDYINKKERLGLTEIMGLNAFLTLKDTGERQIFVNTKNVGPITHFTSNKTLTIKKKMIYDPVQFSLHKEKHYSIRNKKRVYGKTYKYIVGFDKKHDMVILNMKGDILFTYLLRHSQYSKKIDMNTLKIYNTNIDGFIVHDTLRGIIMWVYDINMKTGELSMECLRIGKGIITNGDVEVACSHMKYLTRLDMIGIAISNRIKY